MKSEIDRPIAQLILDLESRGLLNRTLVILASEFSRDMIMEGSQGRMPTTKRPRKLTRSRNSSTTASTATLPALRAL